MSCACRVQHGSLRQIVTDNGVRALRISPPCDCFYNFIMMNDNPLSALKGWRVELELLFVCCGQSHSGSFICRAAVKDIARVFSIDRKIIALARACVSGQWKREGGGA